MSLAGGKMTLRNTMNLRTKNMEPSIRQAPIAHWRSSDNQEQLLEEHLAGVSRLSRAFAAKIGLQDAGDLIGALHDLGKYSKEFQDYLRSAVELLDVDADDYVDAKGLKGKVDHSTAGAQYIWKKLADKGPKERIAAQVLALCIASHHSGLIDCIGGDASNFGHAVFPRRMSKAQDKTHLDEVLRVADKELIARCDELLSNPTMSAAFVSLLERIGQHNAEASAKLTHQQFGLAVRLLFSCLIDADRIDSADFEHKRNRRLRPLGDYVPWPTLIARLEIHLQAFKPRHPIDDLRNQISAHCLAAAERSGGVYTLTVPTGGGKTLASLRFALHHAQQRQLDRVIYVIPFTSIIDQNARDVRDILEPKETPQDKGKVVLEHHASLTPEQQTWREKLLTENWDAPVVYTTMVQFLESLFGGGTRGARRMHQLANAVLVFDEIQTLPIKCVHLFNNAINFLAEQCDTTVLLCTATQPLLHEVAKDKGAIRLKPGHELIRDVPQLFAALKRVDVRDGRKAGGWTYDEIAALALSELARAGSCLVIVNTKDTAKQVFLRCLQGLSVEAVFHLSTDMCPAHRKAVLGRKQESDSKTVIGRLALGLPVLCVSTQLIEAGVDVDFGAVIRSLAGLDSIAQAAGRCNRNGRSATGIVHVVDPVDERVEKLIDIDIGREVTKRVLDDFKASPARYSHSLVSPEALRDYYNYFFFKRADAMAYPVGEKQVGRSDSLLNLLGTNDQASSEYGKQRRQKPDIFLRQAFMTAANIFETIDAPTQSVVVPYGEEGKALIADLHSAFKLDADFDLLRRAQQYTVNVFPQVLEKLHAANALTVAEEGQLRILCLDSRYYSPQFGLSTEPVSLMEFLNA
jgi:CRISPR-associated endonuclease/helicase Cas3